jgi:hypothetical protein
MLVSGWYCTGVSGILKGFEVSTNPDTYMIIGDERVLLLVVMMLFDGRTMESRGFAACAVLPRWIDQHKIRQRADRDPIGLLTCSHDQSGDGRMCAQGELLHHAAGAVARCRVLAPYHHLKRHLVGRSGHQAYLAEQHPTRAG